MDIQRATAADAENILHLQRVAFISEAEIYNDFNIAPLSQSLDELKAEFNTHVFLKAIVDGQLIGSVRACVSVEDGTCYIQKLIVHPDFQNSRVGTTLMNRIEQIFTDCKRFVLWTGHKSSKNLGLYQKLGYRIFKTERIHDTLNLVYLEKLKK
jgi:ribosomal protein S18 acetylase RimI-like enzyme